MQRLSQAVLGLGVGTGLGCASAAPSAGLPEPTAPDFWEQVRAQYPVTGNRMYMNCGGLGPAPFPVLDAQQRTQARLQAMSEHGHRLIGEARGPVAAFLGAEPAEIAFMRNATEGNSTIASGLALEPGDEVVFESHAHPGGSFPWLNRQRVDGIRVKLFEPDPSSAEGNLERIAALVTPRTKVIQVSHVTAPTGIRVPVEAIAAFARERGIWFHIDGAQSAGMLPIDLHAIGCDSFATSGHKWLGAPHGTGLLYVRAGRLDAVLPTETGAYGEGPGTSLPDRFTYHPTAQRFEVGTRDASTIVAMAEAVAFLERIGMERVAARGQELAGYLQERLRAIDGVEVLTPTDPALSGSITTLRAEAVPFTELNRRYAEAGLRCRPVQEQGLNAVRVSTHIFNSEDECDRVVAVTQEAVREG